MEMLFCSVDELTLNTLSTSSYMCVDFCKLCNHSGTHPCPNVDLLIICHAALIKIEPVSTPRGSMVIKLVDGVNPMTRISSQPDLPKTDVIHTRDVTETSISVPS